MPEDLLQLVGGAPVVQLQGRILMVQVVDTQQRQSGPGPQLLPGLVDRGTGLAGLALDEKPVESAFGVPSSRTSIALAFMGTERKSKQHLMVMPSSAGYVGTGMSNDKPRCCSDKCKQRGQGNNRRRGRGFDKPAFAESQFIWGIAPPRRA